VGWKKPAAQGLQLALPAPDASPALQLSHRLAPVVGWYWPAPQLAHAATPSLEEKVPAVQLKQDADATAPDADK
jgi:hypothetical protein